MPDWVRPLKLENIPDGGSMSDSFPKELDPAEDAIQANGIAIVELDINITKDGLGNMVFVDQVTGPHTLSDLLGGGGSSDLDGGFANTVFLPLQSADGGNA